MNEFLKRNAPAKIRQVKQKSLYHDFYHDESNRAWLERECYMQPGESKGISMPKLWKIYHGWQKWEQEEIERSNF